MCLSSNAGLVVHTNVVQQSIKVPIPSSSRAHIIGKQGSTIKSIQERTGAKIQLPKADDAAPYPDDDDDDMIDVIVEGNAHAVAIARDAILKIVGERNANVNTRMKGIPSEFFPFIGRDEFASNLEGNGVQLRIPPHQAWSATPPTAPADGGRYIFAPASDSHVQLAGDRKAVQAAKAEIERLVEQLHEELILQQQSIPKSQHQFIIGNRGIPAEDFFSQTGCVIILPTDDYDDVVTIIGHDGSIDPGIERAMELASEMKSASYDLSGVHRQAPGGAVSHAHNVTRYLRHKKEIERLEQEYNTYINTPLASDNKCSWEFFSRDGKTNYRAYSELQNIFKGHPPCRMGTVPADAFFHQYLRNDVNSRVRQDYGVQLVIPEQGESDAPVLLVYEGTDDGNSAYQLPQAPPSSADSKVYEQRVREAQKHILELLSQQENIQTVTIEVPLKFHERLRRFIKKEQEVRPTNQPPIRVSSLGTAVTLRGPETAVKTLATKVEAFVAQEKEDEKERGFILSFEFPQKFANHLIGKGGSNIRELRDKFDVEIQVQDGKVELKGPKAKAEAAKTHINSLARQLADEATHVLKIDPKFHRELIGAGGATINRLQTRYKVHILFPRTAKPRDDESLADAASEAGKPQRQQNPDEVIVRGPKKGADEARDEILTLYQYLKDNSFTATVSIQQKQIPHLIGNRGSVMESLRQQTGAKIDIPNGRDDPEATVEVQIKGTKTQVAAAKKILEEKRAVMDDTVVKTIDVDRKYHKALIGAQGMTSCGRSEDCLVELTCL
jgi:rRNA processing protein Krr1/Pno1